MVHPKQCCGGMVVKWGNMAWIHHDPRRPVLVAIHSGDERAQHPRAGASDLL